MLCCLWQETLQHTPNRPGPASPCPSSLIRLLALAALTLLSPCPCLGAGGTLNFSLLQPNCQALLVQPSLTTKADTTVLYASPSYSWQR